MATTHGGERTSSAACCGPSTCGRRGTPRATGTIDADELHALEDRAVLEAIALQESAGIEAITDGEFRRTGWIAFIPMVDDPLFEAPVSGFEFLNADVGLARPLEDGRRRSGRHVGAAARGAVRHAPAPGRARHRRRRVRVPEGEREGARRSTRSRRRAGPDLLAPRVLDRRVPDLGRLHRGHRPPDARAHRRPAGRARLRLHPARRAELRPVAHRSRQPRGVRGARPRHGARARRRRRVRQHGLRGPDRRHARDAHVPRQRARAACGPRPAATRRSRGRSSRG